MSIQKRINYKMHCKGINYFENEARNMTTSNVVQVNQALASQSKLQPNLKLLQWTC